MNFRTMSRNVRYYLGKNLPFLDEAAQPVMFFPADSLAARSFSEYPFFVEVLPESMIGRKMVVLYKDVFGSLDAIPESVREWRDLSEPAVEAHVKEYVSSPDDDRAQAVFSVFGLSQMLVLLLITPIVIGIAEIRFKNLSPASIVLMSALILLLGGLDLYTGYVDFRVAAFYEARLRYERRVRALLRKPFSIFYYSAVVRWAALEFLSRAFGGLLIGEGCLIVFFSFLTLLSVFD